MVNGNANILLYYPLSVDGVVLSPIPVPLRAASREKIRKHGSWHLSRSNLARHQLRAPTHNSALHPHTTTSPTLYGIEGGTPRSKTTSSNTTTTYRKRLSSDAPVLASGQRPQRACLGARTIERRVRPGEEQLLLFEALLRHGDLDSMGTGAGNRGRP